jgi:hypothetical protein
VSENRVDTHKAARNQAELELKIARQALPALVARMGGEVIITEEELEERGRAYGGYENLAVQVTRRGDAFVFRTIRNLHIVGRGGET